MRLLPGKKLPADAAGSRRRFFCDVPGRSRADLCGRNVGPFRDAALRGTVTAASRPSKLRFRGFARIFVEVHFWLARKKVALPITDFGRDQPPA
jgi:hypothetical protein